MVKLETKKIQTQYNYSRVVEVWQGSAFDPSSPFWNSPSHSLQFHVLSEFHLCLSMQILYQIFFSSQSPGECSLPSLCSPSRAVDLDDNMNSFMSLSVDTGMTSLSDTDDDLSLRAPYIPMGEDLPLIMSNDLMWGSSLPYKSSCSSSRSSISGSSSSRSPDDSGGGDNSNSGASSPRDSSRSCW